MCPACTKSFAPPLFENPGSAPVWWCSDGLINSQEYTSFDIYAATINISMTEWQFTSWSTYWCFWDAIISWLHLYTLPKTLIACRDLQLRFFKVKTLLKNAFNQDIYFLLFYRWGQDLYIPNQLHSHPTLHQTTIWGWCRLLHMCNRPSEQYHLYQYRRYGINSGAHTWINNPYRLHVTQPVHMCNRSCE